jgi:hypothetical protein
MRSNAAAGTKLKLPLGLVLAVRPDRGGNGNPYAALVSAGRS